MFRKTVLAIAAAVSLLCMTVPAMAETFTSSDGVLSIDLPNENWKEMQDPTKWIVLSDGANVISVDHLSNGEKLPDMSIADDHYVNVYQAVFSTQNEVFIITGSLVDVGKITEVCNAIMSAKVLKYDTKMAVKKETPQVSEFSVVAVDKTMYVTSDGLNVRNGCSTNDQIVGGLSYGASVHVIGVVQRNGADYGWYQVDYNGSAGYVSASFLSDSKPAQKEEKKADGPSFTGKATTIYAMSGTAITIYQATDNYWYDSQGRKYTFLTDYELTNEGGEAFTTNKPVSEQTGPTPTGNTITVYWLNGNAETLKEYSDGSYYSSGWVQYWATGAGTYAGADGTTLYAQEPAIGEKTDENESYGLISDGSGRPVVVNAGGGAYYDESGVEYHKQDDGTFIDQYGATYQVQW